MRLISVFLLLSFGFGFSAWAEETAAPRRRAAPPARAAVEGSVTNPLFAVTHLAPSPLTLPAGRLVLGTDIAFGVTDFLQIGTNVVRLAYQVLNANAKLALFDNELFAFAATYSWERYNLRDFSARNPDVEIQSHQPGAVTAFSLHRDLAFFVAGSLNFTQINLQTSGVEVSGFVRGAQIASDLSWAYNRRRNGLGNVLSPGVTYDLTFKILGLGLSHHWPGFRLGVHYYVNAESNRFLPILAGGAVVDL